MTPTRTAQKSQATHRVRHWGAPALFFSVLLGAIVATSERGLAESGPTETPQAPVYFVPIGTSETTSRFVSELQVYYRETLRLDTGVLPPFAPRLSAWDSQNGQWRAEQLAEQLIEHKEDRFGASPVTLIGIMDDDLASVPDGWVFGWRTPASVGLVSYARMGAATPGPDGDSRLQGRLRRMVTRYVGMLHLNLPANNDPTSPLYARISSLERLDAVSEDLVKAGFLSVRPLLDDYGPIDLATGIYRRRDVDLVVEGAPILQFERIYLSNDHEPRWLPFGIGTNHSYGAFLVGDAKTFQFIDLWLEDGSRIHYTRVSPGTGYAGAVFEHQTTPGRFLHSRLSWHGGRWLIELEDRSSYVFGSCDPLAARPCPVASYRNANGEQTRMSVDSRQRVTKIESNGSHAIQL